MSVRSIGTSLTPVVPQYGKLLLAGTLEVNSYGLAVSGVPQTYRHLKVIIRNAKGAELNGAGNYSYPQCYINGSYNNFVTQTLLLDTNSYYPWYGANFYLGGGTTSIRGSSWAPSAHYEVSIFNYSSTTETKNGHFIASGQSATDRVQWGTGAFHWNSVAAITSFGFATSYQWKAGTTIEVYGEGALG